MTVDIYSQLTFSNHLFFSKELAVYEKMPDQVKITHEGNFALHVKNTEKVMQLQEWHKNVVNSLRVQKDTI